MKMALLLTLSLTSSLLLPSSHCAALSDSYQAMESDPSVENIQAFLERSLTSALSEEGQSRMKRAAHSPISPLPAPVCPMQDDQSKPYNLNSDPTFYPTAEIASELQARSLPGSDNLFQQLSREVVLPGTPPVVMPQPLLNTGNTCPQNLTQLWFYTSVNFPASICWPLANFQEDIFYNAKCMGSKCLGCSDFGNVKYNTTSRTFDPVVKQCLPLYRTVSLWAYCLNLPVNQRIVRDRIIIPSDCSCTSVTCKDPVLTSNMARSTDPFAHPFFTNFNSHGLFH